MKSCLSPASGPPRPRCLKLEGQQSCCSWLEPVSGLSTPLDVIQPFLVCFAEAFQAQRQLMTCFRSHSKLKAEPEPSLWAPSPGLFAFPRNVVVLGFTLGNWSNPGLGRTVGSYVCLKSGSHVDYSAFKKRKKKKNLPGPCHEPGLALLAGEGMQFWPTQLLVASCGLSPCCPAPAGKGTKASSQACVLQPLWGGGEIPSGGLVSDTPPQPTLALSVKWGQRIHLTYFSALSGDSKEVHFKSTNLSAPPSASSAQSPIWHNGPTRSHSTQQDGPWPHLWEAFPPPPDRAVPSGYLLLL